MSNDNSNGPYLVVIDRNDGTDPLVVGFTDTDQAEEFLGAASDLVWEIGSDWYVSGPARPVSPTAAARELLAEVSRGVGDDDPNEVLIDPDVYRDSLRRIKVFAADE